ncbi:MAG TPA: helix-turn-helix transcriptional regulator [Cyclobacteriaceae bacterium]|jgi:transcriptional regulator with XRE-family HTH domain|nr:helix-turn-helix transcriptional regulator [Cyclobacteriaceae bacterium]
MTKPKQAQSHTSKVLDALVNEITPREQARTDNRMLLAIKIDDARKAKGWTQQVFAKEMGQQPSVISKWLSGTHNFTADTMWDIEEKLGVELISLKEREWKVTRVVEYKITVQSPGLFTTEYVSPYTSLSDVEENTIETKPYKYG